MRGRSPWVDSSSASSWGEMVSRSLPGQFLDFAEVAETGAHDLGFVVELLVVVVNAGNGLHAGIVGALVVLAGVFFVPVEDAADEGRDEGYSGFGAGDGLVHAEEQGKIAVNAFFFKHFGGANAGPGGSDLDENVLRGRCRPGRIGR